MGRAPKPSSVRESLSQILAFYNGRRPHSSLDGQTSNKEYQNPASQIPVTV